MSRGTVAGCLHITSCLKVKPPLHKKVVRPSTTNRSNNNNTWVLIREFMPAAIHSPSRHLHNCRPHTFNTHTLYTIVSTHLHGANGIYQGIMAPGIRYQVSNIRYHVWQIWHIDQDRHTDSSTSKTSKKAPVNRPPPPAPPSRLSSPDQSNPSLCSPPAPDVPPINIHYQTRLNDREPSPRPQTTIDQDWTASWPRQEKTSPEILTP